MTTTNKTEYLVNQTKSTIILKGGYVEIPRGGYRVYLDSLRGDQTTEYALEREWLKVTDVEPTGVPVVEVVDITITKPNTGLTEAELLESNKAETKPTDTGKVTALGQEADKTTTKPVKAGAKPATEETK